MASSSRPSNSRVNSFHYQPPPRPESIAMAKQAYLAHQKSLAEGVFIDIGMPKHRSVRAVVSAGINAGKNFYKANVVPKEIEEQDGPQAPVSRCSYFPPLESPPKIPPPRPARDPGWYGVPDEPVRRESQDSDRTITSASWARARTTKAEPKVLRHSDEYRMNPDLLGQDGP